MISKIVISLFIMNFLAGVTLYAMNSAKLLPSYIKPPSLADLDALVNKTKVNDLNIDQTMIFGDFLRALNIIKAIFTGESLAYLISMIGNDKVGWMNYMVQGMYTISLSFLLLKFISNRYFD